MGRPKERGIYYGSPHWFHENNFGWFHTGWFKSQNWKLPKPYDGQTLKLTSKITEGVSIAPGYTNGACLATAVYHAYLLDGNKRRNPVIVKMFLRIPNLPGSGSRDYVDLTDLIAAKVPVTEDLSGDLNHCREYKKEHEILAYLTKSACSSTPRHITHFEQNEANPWVRGGFLGLVVMSKLPGVCVEEIWDDYSDPTEDQLRERRRIQQAFKKALIEVSGLGVTSLNPARRNIMYDKVNSRCYLFDFEDCDLGRKNKAFCWEKHVPVGWHPDVTLMDWEIDTPEVQDRCREFRKQYETANPRY